MKKRRFFRRAFAIAVLATLASANAFGLSTKYFKTEVTATTGGQVYASISPNEDVIFDLNGHKVEKTKLGKGLYIKNGKKIIIK